MMCPVGLSFVGVDGFLYVFPYSVQGISNEFFTSIGRISLVYAK